MKLNIGSGYNKPEGYISVDSNPVCQPDVLHDCDTFPWPWADNSVTEAVFHHSLEHMGQQTSVFLGIMRELYRVCQNGAVITITVPHPRHDSFMHDPTHVRIITPVGLSMFDREMNEQWIAEKASNTTLALYCGVDFKITGVVVVLDERYADAYNSRGIPNAEALARELNNVISEYQITLVCRKPTEPHA